MTATWVKPLTTVGIKSFSITRLKPSVSILLLLRQAFSWNQKFLDYEIETWQRSGATHISCQPLESKVSRLRDWNVKPPSWVRMNARVVGIKSFSITRLKLCLYHAHHLWNPTRWNQKFLDYEIETSKGSVGETNLFMLESKVSRLRDWNDNQTEFYLNSAYVGIKSFSITRLKRVDVNLWRVCPWVWLESKVSRLRDWNSCHGFLVIKYALSWNQKFLDYEIETIYVSHVITSDFRVGIKSFSITRLKLFGKDIELPPELLGWNQKFLDYEIETKLMNNPIQVFEGTKLESKSFSITRLKQEWGELPWKDAYLYQVGIKSFSITRLKLRRKRTVPVWNWKLESKVSRLRDWNLGYISIDGNKADAVGIKSFSITRLKQ